jgi:hypothetical protein
MYHQGPVTHVYCVSINFIYTKEETFTIFLILEQVQTFFMVMGPHKNKPELEKVKTKHKGLIILS